MAVVMFMEWPGVTRENYQAVLNELQLDANPAQGLLFHVATFAQGGMRVTDVWESAQAFKAFSEDRVMSAAKKVGIASQPKVEVHPADNIYVPAMSTIGSLGASSLP